MRIARWFEFAWWQYLFSKPWRQKLTWEIFWCRVKGHPNGTVYYNPGGFEPDYRCKDCGEDLG